MRKITRIWRCKDGSKVRICDMTDSHLQNTIAFLERVARSNNAANLQAAYSVSCMLQGEHASMDCDNAIERMEEDSDGVETLPDIYWCMLNEQERRAKLRAV